MVSAVPQTSLRVLQSRGGILLVKFCLACRRHGVRHDSFSLCSLNIFPKNTTRKTVPAQRQWYWDPSQRPQLQIQPLPAHSTNQGSHGAFWRFNWKLHWICLAAGITDVLEQLGYAVLKGAIRRKEMMWGLVVSLHVRNCHKLIFVNM